MHDGIIPAIKRVEFISHRMPYISLRGCCFQHLRRTRSVFDLFPKYHMNVLLGDSVA